MQNQKNVLIFEDNDADYFLLKVMFENITNEAYKLSRAQSIEDLTKDSIDSTDLVIMDYQLPSDTGVNIIEKLQKQYGYFAPFILLTGFDDPKLYKKLQSLNVYDYFIKSEMSASLLERSCFYAIERFLTNEQYKREREFSEHLTNNLPYIIVKIDLDGNLQKSNDNFSKLKFNLSNSSNKNIETLISRFKSQEPKFSFDYKVGSRTYYTKWQLIESQFDDAMTYIGEDVTKEVEERETEIGRKKLEALGYLAGGIAHELNNTLQPIILRNDIIKDMGQRLLNTELISHADENSIMLRHGASIIHDILEYSNIQEASLVTKNQDIYTEFHNSIDLIKRSLPETVILSIHNDDLLKKTPLAIHNNDLLKILSNIIRNAALSMDMNGRINISLREIITNPDAIASEDAVHNICISITDHGCGMSAELKEKVFSPFFTTRPPGSGTGLGMSVTYSIVTKYNGMIEVESEENVGSTINLIFPLIQNSLNTG
jgi:signal transduction histidine kinase/CheY-like chemotaxis protein